MTITYSIISPIKNVVMTRENVTNFHEGEHGISFKHDGIKEFVSWTYLASYGLVEDEENDT